ncbi:hypothetical protein A374_12590 [Fictibacillus macauensis ZFHKF-1]|uniref:Uncharacterized protein n=1 Tax=Fictibacillus macauensis ZFHKF-1 TaxID=1196324 RepID=I8J068_9BACL|nr:YlzJ-like family protein [Fictibacillus macauensis]EIT85136.1 hypothetical protein A374_12590 [Fictibacillus macauensis ZFHKF-1]
MILYTMMPHDVLFPADQTESKQQQEQWLTYKGVPVTVVQTSPDHYQIVRVMSTDPAHYLLSSCCPGTIISSSLSVSNRKE